MVSHNDIHWYALYTRPRHEKKVARQLTDKGIESYLPMRKVLRQWSDRKKWIEEPLFGCYLFIHVNPGERLPALQTHGTVRLISFRGEPTVVPDREIETIRRILRENPVVETGPVAAVGDMVEIVLGPLTGLQGRLEAVQGGHRFIVSIDSIGQSVRFNVDKHDVKVLKPLAVQAGQ